jgi:hypothetical protein
MNNQQQNQQQNQPLPFSVRSEWKRTNDGKMVTLRDGTPCANVIMTIKVPPLVIDDESYEYALNSALNQAKKQDKDATDK